MRMRRAVLAPAAMALSVVLAGCGHQSSTAFEAPTVVAPTGGDRLRPLHRWTFPEGQGTTAGDAAATGQRMLTLHSHPEWTSGIFDSAISFDGKNQYASTLVPDMHTRGAPYTVTAWVKLAETGDKIQSIVARDSKTGDSAFYLQFDGRTKMFAFGLPQARALAVNAAPVRAGTWYHVAGVQDPEQGYLRIYVDGLLAGATEVRGRAPKPSGPLTVGRSEAKHKPVDFLHGTVDVVQIFPYALTDEQEAGMYNAGSGGQ